MCVGSRLDLSPTHQGTRAPAAWPVLDAEPKVGKQCGPVVPSEGAAGALGISCCLRLRRKEEGSGGAAVSLSPGVLVPCPPHRSAGQPERGELRRHPHGVLGRLAEPRLQHRAALRVQEEAQRHCGAPASW